MADLPRYPGCNAISTQAITRQLTTMSSGSAIGVFMFSFLFMAESPVCREGFAFSIAKKEGQWYNRKKKKVFEVGRISNSLYKRKGKGGEYKRI